MIFVNFFANLIKKIDENFLVFFLLLQNFLRHDSSRLAIKAASIN